MSASWVRVGNAADEDEHRYVNLDKMTQAYVLALAVPSGSYGIQVTDGTTTYDVFGRWTSKEDASNAVNGLVRGFEADHSL
jgi:hypothetical protein